MPDWSDAARGPIARVPSLCGLRRDRLARVLDRVVSARLGMVVAPAGSGKTTLLAAWSRDVRGEVAWVRTTHEDDAASLVARVGESWGFTPRPRDGVADLLRALHQDADRPRLLVLDDVHALTDPGARSVLERLVTDAPPTTCALLSSRVAPDLDLVHSEVCVSPVLIGREDLRFRSWEVESLFRDVYQAPLSPDEAAALARHTGGWAAALHLFHLSTTGQSPAARHKAIQALAGRNRYARRYLYQQVLVGLGPERSTFMRRTAVLDTLTARRCDSLLARTDSQAVLEDLVSRHALTTTEDDGATFRYHEVLRRHLEADLETELGTEQLLRWCHQAAELLEAEGALVEALRVRARARDWSGVRSLLVRSGLELTGRADAWTGLVPDAMLADDPWVGLAQARRLLGDGQLKRAADAARAARGALADPRADEQVRELLAVTRAWEQLECPPTRRWHEQVAQSMRQLRHPASGPFGSPGGDQEVLARPFLAVLHGDPAGARDAALLASSRVDPHSPTALALRLVEALAALLTHDPTATELAENVAAEAEVDYTGWFVRASRGLLAAVNPDPLVAVADLDRLVASCDALGDVWGAVWASVLAALAASGLPDALTRVDRARARLEPLGARVPATWLEALAAHVCLRTDAREAARRAQASRTAALEVGCPGAHAVATTALAQARSDATLLRSATAMAREAGVTLAALVPGEQPRTKRTGAPATVSVRLLGRFELSVGDRVLDPSPLRPQARALLRLLALEAGRAPHRDRLAEVLWPGQPGTGDLHRLHVAMSSLRRWLEDQLPPGCPPLIERREECYRLRLPVGSRSDLHELRSALHRAEVAHRAGDRPGERAALHTVLDLYTGDLLPEDLAEPVAVERDHLRILVASACGALAEQLMRSDPRAAVTVAQRGIDLDQCSDGAWRCLIRGYDELGEIARAQRARNAYADVLREVGVVPPRPRQERVLNSTSAMATRRP